MSERTADSQTFAAIRDAGHNNVEIMGLDVNRPVFVLSALVAIVSSALVLAISTPPPLSAGAAQ